MNQSQYQPKSVVATATQPHLADSEGDSSPPLSKHRRVTRVPPYASAQMDEVRAEVGNDFTKQWLATQT